MISLKLFSAPAVPVAEGVAVSYFLSVWEILKIHRAAEGVHEWKTEENNWARSMDKHKWNFLYCENHRRNKLKRWILSQKVVL